MCPRQGPRYLIRSIYGSVKRCFALYSETKVEDNKKEERKKQIGEASPFMWFKQTAQSNDDLRRKRSMVCGTVID